MSAKVKKPKRALPQGVYIEQQKDNVAYRVGIFRNYEKFQGGTYKTVEEAVIAYTQLDNLLKQYEI